MFDHTEEELLAMGSPVALVILACQAEAQDEKLSEEQLNNIKIRIMDALQAHGDYDIGQITRFVRFLNNLIYLQNPVLNNIFVEHVQKITKGKVTMGIMETIDMLIREETEAKTRHEDKKEFVTNLIENTDFDDTKIASLAIVSVDFVQKLRASLAEKAKN